MLCLVRRLLVCVISVPRSRPYQKTIGETIRKHRRIAKISQEKLAEKAELHPVYLGQLERGEQTASVYALLRVAKALGVRLRDLVADL